MLRVYLRHANRCNTATLIVLGTNFSGNVGPGRARINFQVKFLPRLSHAQRPGAFTASQPLLEAAFCT